MPKIGLSVQLFATNNVEFNIKVIEKSAIQAKSQNVDILCFGEAVLQGFHSLNGEFARDIQIAMEKDGKNISKIKKIAKDNSIALGFGYIEREGDSIFSSYLVVDKNGMEICNFRRVSVGWKEQDWDFHYKEGKTFATFDYLNKKFAVGLCGDFWADDDKLPSFPHHIVLWPVYIDSDYTDWQNGSAIAEYADQASKFSENVLLVNSLLGDNQNSASGRAMHFFNGKILSQLDLNIADILVCEI